MSFVVGCACGKKFRVEEDRLGERAKCPGCGALLELLPAETAAIDWKALAELDRNAKPTPGSAARGTPPLPEKQAQSRQHPCPSCGRKISIFAIGCEFCGTRVGYARPRGHRGGAVGGRRAHPLNGAWRIATALSVVVAVGELAWVAWKGGSALALFTAGYAVMAMALISLLGAVLLRAAASLYNLLCGGENSPQAVPVPPFSHAMEIAFLSTLVNLVVAFALSVLVGTISMVGGAHVTQGALMAQALSSPLSLLVSAVGLTQMLPTTFPRALAVGLCFVLMLVAFFMIAGVALAMAGFAFSA